MAGSEMECGKSDGYRILDNEKNRGRGKEEGAKGRERVMGGVRECVPTLATR